MEREFSLSVVIPTCDREALLREALECVLTQSVLPDEVIIINNGRSKVALGALPEFVRVIDIMPYAGASQARNFGVLLAQGDYIAFLDDDDLWEKDYVRKVKAFIVEQQQPDCILTRLDKLIDDKIQSFKDPGAHDDLLAELLVRNPGSGGTNTVIKKQVFIAVGGFDCKMSALEDVSFTLELLLKQYQVMPASHIQAIVREHAGEHLSASRTSFEGRRIFFAKYHHLMNRRQKYRFKSAIYAKRYQFSGSFRWLLASRFFRFMWRLNAGIK